MFDLGVALEHKIFKVWCSKGSSKCHFHVALHYLGFSKIRTARLAAKSCQILMSHFNEQQSTGRMHLALCSLLESLCAGTAVQQASLCSNAHCAEQGSDSLHCSFSAASLERSLSVQVRNLRERLEEEHQALLTREQDKAALELRIARLTKLILHSTRITTSTAAARKQRISLLRSFSEHLCPTVSFSLLRLKCFAGHEHHPLQDGSRWAQTRCIIIACDSDTHCPSFAACQFQLLLLMSVVCMALPSLQATSWQLTSNSSDTDFKTF